MVSITAHFLKIVIPFLLILSFCSPVGADVSPLVEKMVGEQFSLHSEKQRVSTIFRAIARQTGITIYIDESITDTISLEMDERSLYDIFTLILEAKHLKYVEKNGILFIKREADSFYPQDLLVKRICTKFGDAKEYRSQLNGLLSENGSITVTDRGGCILVKDNQENIDSIETMVKELDRPILQVHIKAKIVTINQDARKRLGIRWGLNNKDTNGTTTELVLDQSNLDQTNTATNSLLVGIVKNQMNLEFQIQALQEEGHLSILSSPHILVLDGKTAEIKQGTEIPYVTSTTDSVNTSFKEANLSLKVTPKILKGEYLILDLSVTNDNVSVEITGDQPTIDTQEISSTLFLKNEETIVIGGIILENKDNNKQQVPILGDIPVLGHLFRNKNMDITHSELNVFITPTIVDISKRMEQTYLNKENSEESQATVTQPIN